MCKDENKIKIIHENCFTTIVIYFIMILFLENKHTGIYGISEHKKNTCLLKNLQNLTCFKVSKSSLLK